MGLFLCLVESSVRVGFSSSLGVFVRLLRSCDAPLSVSKMKNTINFDPYGSCVLFVYGVGCKWIITTSYRQRILISVEFLPERVLTHHLY